MQKLISAPPPINTWDHPLDYVLEGDEVFTGLHSVHQNATEDRVWDLQVCKLRQKCTEITSIEYETEVSDVSFEEVLAGHGSFDNTNGATENSVEVTISHSARKSLTESYSYSQISRYEKKMVLEVTIGKCSVTSDRNNFQRIRRNYIDSEENGRQMKFTSNCYSGCFCEMYVVVTTAKGVIPYVMKSQSVDGLYICEEKGELTADYSFDGKATENEISLMEKRIFMAMNPPKGKRWCFLALNTRYFFFFLFQISQLRNKTVPRN